MSVEDAIGDVLSRYPGPTRPIDLPQRIQGSGGLSGAILWRYRSELGPLVLRAWPGGFRDRDRLARIDRWLGHLKGLPFIPVPIARIDGKSFVDHAGRFWQVSPWLSGNADLQVPPAIEHVEAAFHGLARVHERLADVEDCRLGLSPGASRRFHELEALRQGGFERLENVVRRSESREIQNKALEWMRRAREILPSLIEPARVASRQRFRLQPAIRDTRRDHFLFQDGLLSGLVDFGAMDLETPAGDLARLMEDWLWTDPDGTLNARAIASYTRVRALDSAEIDNIPTHIRSTSVLATAHWIRWHFVEHRTFEDPQAVERGIERGLSRLGYPRPSWK